MKPTILVVDDEQSIRSSLRDLLQDEGYGVELDENGEDCLARFQGDSEAPVDAVLLDVWLPKMDGLEVLKSIKRLQPNLPVIMLSGHGNIDTAVTATKNGAYHFVEKPFSEETLLLTLSNALRQTKLEQENVKLRASVQRIQHKVVGNSPSFLKMMEQIDRVASSDAWVLIHGENGTGKESVAHLIHNNSGRKEGPFVEVNCAAIPEELIESELFGHEKGAFTGATARKIGKFDQANGGTLFLDEIADMSLKTQAKMLRVLQEQRFERVGGNRTITVNVRVIAASNKNLGEEISTGRFREDLYYRLNVLQLDVPPLREREGDVALLVPFFMDYFSTTLGHRPKRISKEALAILQQYQWPGNIRELKNIVERMMIMVSKEEIEVEHIPPALLQAVGRKAPNSLTPDLATLAPAGTSYRDARDAFERHYLRTMLEQHGWNISKTAEAISLERSNLHKKIKQLGIEMS
ncbi:MAG: sigma-54 dependent transcriptional regulator [Deltaproteobacteria bacterium]|nr:sigma-54 dependent transcriptional regulator [Deltaproteobacteria bacterium]